MIFDSAKSIPAKKTAAAKRGEKEQVELKGLKNFALLSSLIKNLETLKKTIEGEVKDLAFDKFLVLAKGKRPENFRGVEDGASASVEVRKRSTASKLSDEEVAALEAANVSYETVTDVTGTFVINPDYLGDTKLMGAVEQALSTVAGLPKDFILKQEPETRRVVSEDALDEAFATGDEDVIRLVTVLALKPTVEQGSLKEALELAAKLVDPATNSAKLKAKLKESVASDV